LAFGGNMSRLSKRNPIVLRIEHGHPGYTDHQVTATRDTLRTFITRVVSKLDVAGEKPGLVESVECTLAHERADHVYLSFHVVTEDDVERYHTPLASTRVRKALGLAYHLAAFVLAVYGLFRLVRG